MTKKHKKKEQGKIVVAIKKICGFGLIVITELLRHIALRRRTTKMKLIVLSVIALSMVEIATKFSIGQLDSNTQILKFTLPLMNI